MKFFDVEANYEVPSSEQSSRETTPDNIATQPAPDMMEFNLGCGFICGTLGGMAGAATSAAIGAAILNATTHNEYEISSAAGTAAIGGIILFGIYGCIYGACLPRSINACLPNFILRVGLTTLAGVIGAGIAGIAGSNNMTFAQYARACATGSVIVNPVISCVEGAFAGMR